MKKLSLLLLTALFVIALSACGPAPATTTATPTEMPTATATPSLIATLTQTLEPSPTATTKPITVSPGAIYYEWGRGQFSAPYLVWGAHLRDTMNGSCQGFICDGKDLREYDPAVWHFLVKGEYGKMTFTFDKPYDTFVITYKDIMGFDALSGTTSDGKIVTYGYLVDGTISASYMDTWNFSMKTIGDAEDNQRAVTKPCGMIDPNINGDSSFNMTLDPGGIVFNFLDRGFYNSPYATRKGYELTNLTIISAPASAIFSNMICP
jgi:hypothetical protein